METLWTLGNCGVLHAKETIAKLIETIFAGVDINIGLFNNCKNKTIN